MDNAEKEFYKKITEHLEFHQKIQHLINFYPVTIRQAFEIFDVKVGQVTELWENENSGNHNINSDNCRVQLVS